MGNGKTILLASPRPMQGQRSIQRVFTELLRRLETQFNVSEFVVPRESRGIRGRILNLWAMRQAKAAIVHVIGDSHYLCLGRRRGKTILTVHDCVNLHRTRGWRRTLIYLLWFHLPFRYCNRITAISEFTRQELIDLTKIEPARVVVIHDPLVGEWQPVPRLFQPAKPVILHVGTAPNKNLDRVVSALQGLSCELITVGRLDAKVVAQLRLSGIEHRAFADVSEEVLHQLYERCDIVSFPSLYEGFGLPILEANASGRPVLTSNCCSMPEVASNAACLVDPLSVESIRQGFLKIIGNSEYREQLVANGFRNIQRFHPDRIAAAYAELYRQVLSEHPAAVSAVTQPQSSPGICPCE